METRNSFSPGSREDVAQLYYMVYYSFEEVTGKYKV